MNNRAQQALAAAPSLDAFVPIVTEELARGGEVAMASGTRLAHCLAARAERSGSAAKLAISADSSYILVDLLMRWVERVLAPWKAA